MPPSTSLAASSSGLLFCGPRLHGAGCKDLRRFRNTKRDKNRDIFQGKVFGEGHPWTGRRWATLALVEASGHGTANAMAVFFLVAPLYVPRAPHPRVGEVSWVWIRALSLLPHQLINPLQWGNSEGTQNDTVFLLPFITTT